MSSPRVSWLRLGLLVVPLGLAGLTACGNGSGDVAKDPATHSSSPAASGAALPACSDVWKAGGTIPKTYRGCMDGATTVPAHRQPCASGQVIVTYADSYYGVLGGPVNPVSGGLKNSAKYRSATGACD